MFRFLVVFLGSATPLSSADADLILHNGKILTVDSRFTVQQAVAIRSGRPVGPDSYVLRAERGPKTEVIDLHGRTLLPGTYMRSKPG